MTIRELIEALEEIAKRTPMGEDQPVEVSKVKYDAQDGLVWFQK